MTMPKTVVSKKTRKAAVSRGVGTKKQDQRSLKPAGGMALCENCGAVYYDGHWHTAPVLSSVLQKSLKTAKHELCLQCRWTAEGREPRGVGFEGEVVLDGLTDVAEKAEILRTIHNVGSRAQERDPEDRIIAIDDRGERVVVTTTENQLAAAIGKAVDAAHKGGQLVINFSRQGDLPARVYWKRKAK